MRLQLDHIVILVHDLAAATADYGRLGFTVLPGGDHADGRTHNALVVFQDGAYLELIAFKRPVPEARWWKVGDRDGEGFVDYALLPDDIASVIREAGERGLPMEGPTPGGRLRPDGERLEWQTGRAASADTPFLCFDVTPRRLRVPEEGRVHPNGVTGIASVTVAVQDLAASAARYAALLGEPVPPVGALAGLGLSTASLRLGPARLDLVGALDLTRPAGAEIARYLDRRGERPYGLAFAVPGAEARPLDLALAHGARLDIVAG